MYTRRVLEIFGLHGAKNFKCCTHLVILQCASDDFKGTKESLRLVRNKVIASVCYVTRWKF